MVIEMIIDACPQVKFLITSRSTLDLACEIEYRIQPFKIPSSISSQNLEELSNIEAVSLFLQKAGQVKSFSFDEQNAKVILKICQELEGVPLAIELAASRLKILSPQQILARLRDSFSLLKSNRSVRQKRHQTISETIRWSYDLLSDAQKKFFRAYSIFNVSFTIDSAEALMPEVDALEALELLLNHSLIRRLESSRDEARFGMLRLIREFGQKELAANPEEDQAIRERYINHYFDFLRKNNEYSAEVERHLWLENIDAEFDNLRSIGAYFMNTQDPRLRSFLVLFWRYYLLRGYLKEGYDLTTQAIAASSNKSDSLQGELLSAAGTFAHNLGAFKSAKSNFSEALQIFVKLDVALETCRTLNHLAWAEFRLGGYVRSEEYADAALGLAEKHHFAKLKATALNNRAWVTMFRGYYPEALSLQNDIREIYKKLNDARGLAFSKTNSAWALIHLNKKNEATELLDAALETFGSLGDRQLLAFTLCIKSLTVSDSQIRSTLKKSLDLFGEIGDSWGLGLAYHFQASYYFRHEELGFAQEALNSSLEIRKRINDNWGIVQCHLIKGQFYFYLQNLFEAQRHLSTALQMAEQMETPGPIKDISVLLGQIELAQGQKAKSKIRFQRAMIEARKQGDIFVQTLKDKFERELNILDMKNSALEFP